MTTPQDPFAALGLPATGELTDQQVHAAWRAVAAATHPDRPDGGDPARYAQASAAHAELRTPWGRTEALADLRDTTTPARRPPPATAQARPARTILTAAASLPARVRHGRPLHITARALIAAAAAAWAALTFAPGTPAAPAAVTGCALWLILTSRHDLAPPPGR